MRRLPFCGFLLGLAVCAGIAGAAVWNVAPPPPASWEHDRVADLVNRRHHVMEKLGAHGILMLYAAEPRNYAGDVDWPYRQEDAYYYLTGVSQPGGTLLLMAGAARAREILFLPPLNPERETWTGHMMTAEEARRVSGIQEVWDAALLNPLLATLMPWARGILPDAGTPAPDWKQEFRAPIEQLAGHDAQFYMLLPARPAAVYRREEDFAAKLASAGADMAVNNAAPIFATLRSVKSAREIDLLQHAVDITAEAFQRAYALAVPGTWEYEIQAQFEFTFLRRNGRWGYPCIVGSGNNATVLHYQSNRSRMGEGDLVLMDDGAEFAGYSADVTRTIPVSGKYTSRQADIYRLVWEAQQAGIQAARPGRSISGRLNSINAAASRVFRQGLLKLGLITDPASDTQLRLWFNHGISHGIGLNVHDPAGAELEPGMVITVEPGLYFRPDALDGLTKTEENGKFAAAVRPAFEKYKGIGVRIEDDVLITAGEPKIVSIAIPSRLEEVEAAIARYRKTIRNSPLP